MKSKRKKKDKKGIPSFNEGAAEISAQKTCSPLPKQIWLIAALLVLLKGLPAVIPFLFTLAPNDIAYLPIGYIPKDWFAYAALIHEGDYSNSFFLYNPFTTEWQYGRFILLFHRFLGLIHFLTKANVFWLLELSRIPLIFLFMLVLWRFLFKVLNNRKRCLWACWLIAFSGGLEFFLIMILPKLELAQDIVQVIYQQLWPLYGWNTFESFYNPLWIASLILLMLILERLMNLALPFKAISFFFISFGIVILWYIHSYSGIAAIVIFLGYIIVSLIFDNPQRVRQSLLNRIGAIVLGLLIIALISYWQHQDPIFKKTSGAFFGVQDASIFWYPLTFALLIPFCIKGIKIMATEGNPWVYGISGWIIGIMILHSSPIFNGYKFVMYLHMPIAIAVAPALSNWISSQKRNIFGYFRSFLVLVIIFISTFFVTQEMIKEVRAYGIPRSWILVIENLKDLKAGNVLAPMPLSNVLPSFTPHRVFNGHWFMTPDSSQKSQFYITVMYNPLSYSNEINKLIDNEKIKYIVHPAQSADPLKQIIQEKIVRTITLDEWVIFILK